VNAEDITRIKRMHRPMIVWLGCTVGWVCMCGSPWPCAIVVRTVATRTWPAGTAMTLDPGEVNPGEFWRRR
jgi:hypothetical protein